MTSTLGDIALGVLISLGAAIGLLPMCFGWNGLSLCSYGALIYGGYSFVLPRRIVARLKPRVRLGTPADGCIRDLVRAWGLFSMALGAMGLVLCIEMEDGNVNKELQMYGNYIFLAVGLASVAWDYHLMRSQHWEATTFFWVNLSVNIAICFASGSSLVDQ